MHWMRVCFYGQKRNWYSHRSTTTDQDKHTEFGRPIPSLENAENLEMFCRNRSKMIKKLKIWFKWQKLQPIRLENLNSSLIHACTELGFTSAHFNPLACLLFSLVFVSSFVIAYMFSCSRFSYALECIILPSIWQDIWIVLSFRSAERWGNKAVSAIRVSSGPTECKE